MGRTFSFAPASAAAVAAMTLATASARAQTPPEPAPAHEPPGPMPVAFGADEVRFDERARALDASGHVHVDATPFHLTSDELAIKRVPIGVELDGQGELAFCPCLGTPLAVRFNGATVAPPHDVIVRKATLLVFGVPLAWFPVVWLRSPGRLGLLTPEVAWRGADGLFLGEGVHVPWTNGDAVRGLDLRAGAYVDGGAAVDATLHTITTDTRIRWDMLHDANGVGIDAHGATAIAAPERVESAAWEVDALRGARAVHATTDLDAAARPFDHAQGEMAWRTGGWTLASGVRASAIRGSPLQDVGVGGPIVAARRADALGHAGAYDATVEGGSVSGAGFGTTSFARAEGGTLLATRLGPFGARLAVRGLGDVSNDGTRAGADGAGQARATVALPVARGFASAEAADPWVHLTEPRVELAGVATHTDGVLVVPAGRGAQLPDGTAWIAAAAWRNAFGRWGSRGAAEVDFAGGAVGQAERVAPVLRARGAVGGEWAALRADFARVLAPTDARGGAFVARARVGPERSLHLGLHAAQRDAVDPLLARVLADAPLEPASAFLLAPGWTGGARAAVPIGARVTASGGADVDFDAAQLVAAVGALELHDPCGCVVVRATVAHRIGRDGVDAWLTVDLPTTR